MPIIDSQVHAYEANTPKRPWATVPNWPPHVTGDEMVAAMDKVGVDGAIFISSFSMYRYDGSYAEEVARQHPGRMVIVKPVDPDDANVADVVAKWKETKGAVGIRIFLREEEKRAPDHPGLDRICKAAVDYDLPLNFLFWGRVDDGIRIIDRHPNTRFIVDHLGAAAAARPAGAGRTVGRPAEDPRSRQAPERRDQGERRLHAVEAALPVPRHLGSAEARVRRLGLRALPLGHGLDARLRRRELRERREAVPGDQDAERQRTRHADGRRLRQGLRLVAE